MQSVAGPPEQTPGKYRQGEARFERDEPLPVPVQLPARKQRAEADRQRTQEGTVDEGVQRLCVLEPGQKGAAGAELQQQTEPARKPAVLMDADPHQRRAFERPGRRRPVPAEGERNGETAEHHPQREERLGQQPHAGALPLPERARQRDIEGAERQRAERQPVLQVVDQRALQREARQRHTEHQAAVDVAFQLRRLALREQHRDRGVEQEEQYEEGFSRVEILGPVAFVAPGRADHEREQEPDEVQFAPGLEPGDAEDAGVEQRIIGEQRDVIAAAAGQQDGRDETAGGAEHRHDPRVLQHRQHAGQRDEAGYQRERKADRHQVVEFRRAERRQVQNRDRAALQHQAVGAGPFAQPPADDQYAGRR